MTVIRLLYSLAIFTNYVAVVYPIRRIFMDWLRATDMATRRGKLAYYFTGIAMVIVTAGLSIAIPNIATIIDFVSSFFGVGIFWCIPILFIWKEP